LSLPFIASGVESSVQAAPLYWSTEFIWLLRAHNRLQSRVL
jgi:hypothetical protein